MSVYVGVAPRLTLVHPFSAPPSTILLLNMCAAVRRQCLYGACALLCLYTVRAGTICNFC